MFALKRLYGNILCCISACARLKQTKKQHWSNLKKKKKLHKNLGPRAPRTITIIIIILLKS